MTRHDPLVRLRHMLDHAREAVEMQRARVREDLDDDRQFALALTHVVEIVGEAASQVSPVCQAQYTSIPWPKIMNMRHRLIHGYDMVDYDILWDTIAQDFPLLISELEKIIPKSPRQSFP